ncbi:hypothetical protein ACFW7J_24805 [Streptomyces sp. NPDC059525]|uniref:hypothetical protein n=1 Tax=Streptomyces sp. NPDC059525 TaxID=3346857 RepID=UPI003688CE7F
MSPSDRRIRRACALGGVLCAVLAAGACAAAPARPGSAHAAHAAHAAGTASATPSASASASATVEQIAEALGCTAELGTQAEELRQGACQTGQGVYRMTTFAAEAGLRSWLAEAEPYGGFYLVGNRWVVTAQSADALAGLRERLGGSVETGAAHTGH